MGSKSLGVISMSEWLPSPIDMIIGKALEEHFLMAPYNTHSERMKTSNEKSPYSLSLYVDNQISWVIISRCEIERKYKSFFTSTNVDGTAITIIVLFRIGEDIVINMKKKYEAIVSSLRDEAIREATLIQSVASGHHWWKETVYQAKIHRDPTNCFTH
jgi:hypothetical protein